MEADPRDAFLRCERVGAAALCQVDPVAHSKRSALTGALGGGRAGPVELLQQRLRCGRVKEALGILEAMDWCMMGDECFLGLTSVTNHLLRLELTAEREGGTKASTYGDVKLKAGNFWACVYSVCLCCLSAAQLEAALGVFYAPPSPLSDVVILEYRRPISKLARRFFHHLLRYRRPPGANGITLFEWDGRSR